MPSPLAEQFELPTLAEDGFLVRSGSPARYLLSAGPNALKSIAAIRVLARRHVPLIVAKRTIEAMLDRKEAIVDVPMVEDGAAFECELAALGVRSSRCEPELQNAAK